MATYLTGTRRRYDESLKKLPSLERTQKLLDELLHELLTSEWLEENPTAPLEDFAPSDVLAGVKRYYQQTDNVTVKGNAFDICAYVVREEAAPWIREISEEPIPNLIALSFCRALASCLGEEAFDIAVRKIEREFPNQVALTAHALLAFESKYRILDWIETYVQARQPAITKEWGQLAAVAGINWPRIDDWLSRDSLLGLIALDAIHCCLDHDAGEGGWLYTYEPTLGKAADSQAMAQRLRSYAEAHCSPRVTRTVDTLLDHLR